MNNPAKDLLFFFKKDNYPSFHGRGEIPGSSVQLVKIIGQQQLAIRNLVNESFANETRRVFR